MGSGYYLLDNPLRRSQFRSVRRAKPSGTIVLHTAENVPDVRPPDTGAEGVARFIRDRAEPASYHTLVDADSILPLVPYTYESFHDGTGSNPWSVGFSVAMQAHQWPDLPAWWIEGAIRNLATECRRFAGWYRGAYGITVPATRLSRSACLNRAPGFTTHADRETWAGSPGRRSDPGARFPWEMFFDFYTGTAAEEDDLMISTLAWLRRSPGSNETHCYRINGNVASWCPTIRSIEVAHYLGAQWWGGKQENAFLDPDVWGSLAILNGPLKNS